MRLLYRSLLALLLAPSSVVAQVITTFDAGAASVTYDNGFGANAATLTPTFRLESALSTVIAAGTVSMFDAGGWSTQGQLSGSFFTPALGPLRAELALAAGGSAHEDLTRTGQTLGQLRAHLMGTSTGAWLGGGIGRTWDGAIWRAVSLIEGGGWMRLGPALVVASVTPTRVGDSSYTDMQGALRLTRGRWEVAPFAGARTGYEGASESVWGGASVLVWLTRHVAVVGGGGTYPIDPTQGYPGGRYATVALRLASQPPAIEGNRALAARPAVPAIARPNVASFVVRDVTGVRRLVRATAPGARRVEIAGDFTNWRAVPMTRTGDGRWELAMSIPPGTHRFNLRVDGGDWGVPPGVTVITDDFEGVVGLLTVR